MAETVAGHLKHVPASVRPTVQAARRTVKAVAPKATEIAYQSRPPRSRSARWKIIRYVADDAPVVAIGTFSTYASRFFFRGRALGGGRGLLEAGGKVNRAIRLLTPRDAAR